MLIFRAEVFFVRITVLTLALVLGAGAMGAQEQACVYNKPGGGFIAKMRVCVDGKCGDWSGNFPIGQTKCQSLTSYSSTANIRVDADAVLGKSVACSPSFKRNTEFTGTVVFHTWGTTLSPKCEEPGGAASETCVYNEPGGGFLAKMRVCKPNASCDDNANCSAWSGNFAIGNSSCQKLTPNSVAGQPVKICLNAVAGSTTTCLPQPNYVPTYTQNIVYHAFGTTAQPACKVPGL
jgi:hypothetical protein